MSETTAIANAYAQGGFMRLAQFNSSAAAKELAGFEMRFDRIKVPSGGGTTYMLPEPDANGNTDVKELNAVILFHHAMQSYFPGKYTGSNTQPECSSMDGNFGTGNPGGRCAHCYLNQFGTAENNAKACKRKHRIYILREGELFPMILDVPTLSVENFGKYLRRLVTYGKDPGAIVTKFALQKAVNKGGIAYSQVTFAEGRALTQEEYSAVRRLAQQVQAYSQSVQYDAEDMDAVPVEAPPAEVLPAYDPETGEVIEAAASNF